MNSKPGKKVENTPGLELKTSNLKFIADAMLGRLARWLRLLGFDTLYQKDITDLELLRIARKDNRIVLTRDTHFLRFKNFTGYFLIHSNNTFEQLKEIITEFKISRFEPTRCTTCNSLLTDVQDKKYVKGIVPDYVYIHTNRFMMCYDCGNVYWEGSHIKRFRERVVSLLGESLQ